MIIETSTDVTANGEALLAAYATAKTMPPASGDRMTVIVPPAQYDLGSGALLLDADDVDLAGLTANWAAQLIFGTSNGANTDILMQTASDVRIENLSIECTLGSVGVTGSAADPEVYWPNVTWYDDAATTDTTSSPENTIVRNCEFS